MKYEAGRIALLALVGIGLAGTVAGLLFKLLQIAWLTQEMFR